MVGGTGVGGARGESREGRRRERGQEAKEVEAVGNPDLGPECLLLFF